MHLSIRPGVALAALLLAAAPHSGAAAALASNASSRTLLGKPQPKAKPSPPASASTPPGQVADKPMPPGQVDRTSPQATKPKNGECIIYESSSTKTAAIDAWTELSALPCVSCSLGSVLLQFWRCAALWQSSESATSITQQAASIACSEGADTAAACAVIDLQKFYCTGVSDPATMQSAFDGRITAIAELLLSVRLICKAQGNKMLACGHGWAGAHAFASASYDAWAAAYARTGTWGDCTCGQELFADAGVTVNAWAEVWADIYASLDLVACVSGTSALHSNLTSAMLRSAAALSLVHS